MITVGAITRWVDQAKTFTVLLGIGKNLAILLLLFLPSLLRKRYGIYGVKRTNSWSIQRFHIPISNTGMSDVIRLLIVYS